MSNDDEFEERARRNVDARFAANRKALVENQIEESQRLKQEQRRLAGDMAPEHARDRQEALNERIKDIEEKHSARLEEIQKRHDSFGGRVKRVFGGGKQQRRELTDAQADKDRNISKAVETHAQREERLFEHLQEKLRSTQRDGKGIGERHQQAQVELQMSQERTRDEMIRREKERLEKEALDRTAPPIGRDP